MTARDHRNGLAWFIRCLDNPQFLLARPPATTHRPRDHFDTLILARHKSVPKDIPKPFRLCVGGDKVESIGALTETYYNRVSFGLLSKMGIASSQSDVIAQTNSGYGWGDNPGDSTHIMNGWTYAQDNFR